MAGLVCLLAASPSLAQVPLALAPGDMAPDLGGANYPIESRFDADWGANFLTLVNFWATWCEPCAKEAPALEALYRANKDRGFVILGVFEPWEVDRVAPFLENLNVELSYPLVRPDATVDGYWGGVNIKPTSFLIDSSGRILRKYVGARPEQTAGIGADVHALFDGKPMPPLVMPTESFLGEEQEEEIRKRTKAAKEASDPKKKKRK